MAYSPYRVSWVEGLCRSLGYERLANRDSVDFIPHQTKPLGEFVVRDPQ